VKSVEVLPTWIEAIMPRSTAVDHTMSQSGCPGGTGAVGRPYAVERKNAR